ncbi:hypothetical protein ACFYYB_33800 [Streptomyces sp. NPDC002886]|uniref:hypothetical protein n=1 Tax=Streptomyces sp. NPDC002886 TaxID=3364667 RepID=UPI0036765BDF
MSDANVLVREDADHPLVGREVIHCGTGRTGTVGTVLVRTAKATARTIRRTAHMRPLHGSGGEWPADPRELEPLRHLAPDMPAGAR